MINLRKINNVLKLIICVRNGQFEFKYVLGHVLNFDNFMNIFIFNYHKDSYLFHFHKQTFQFQNCGFDPAWGGGLSTGRAV